MLPELRRAFRALANSPGFTFAAVATLAIGIGANAAVFSLVRSVLWRPLPYADAGSLVRIGHLRKSSARPADTFSPQDFEDLERAGPASGFSAVAAWQFVPGLTGLNLIGSGEPARLDAAFVSAGFFSTLGTRPLLGRALLPEENVSGRDRVVVLSRRVWSDRFGADPRIVGKTVRFDAKRFSVVGVMPADFAFPSAAADVWVPLSLMGEDDVPHQRGIRWMEAVGRLSPRTSLASARSAASAFFARLESQYPDTNAGYSRAVLEPLSEFMLGDVRRPLLILLGAVGLVLLILCANLAGLLLSRAGARRREIAIRTALGASRARIVRHLLLETAILAAAGGTGGLLAGSWALALLRSTVESLPRGGETRLDLSSVLFTFAITTLTGIAFGLFPALQAARPDVARALESGGRSGSADAGRRRLLRGIVVGECLLAGVLLAGAGLLAKSFWRLTSVDPGLRPENVLTLSVTIDEQRYTEGEREEAYRSEILRTLRALPGVRAVGASKTMPLQGGGEAYSFSIDGLPEAQARLRPEAGTFIVMPGYFEALGIPIRAGRGFVEDDIERRRRVLVVSESIARQAWPGKDAVGRILRLGPKARFEVVGVAGDVRQQGLERRPGGAVYVTSTFFPRSTFKAFLRFSGDPRALASAARAGIWSVNREQPVSDIATLPQVFSHSVGRPRFFMLLLAGFGGAALFLAGLGLYGTLSYGIRQRRREIGVRMALGAGTPDVLRLVLGEGARLSILGIALSIPATLAVSHLMASLLFEVGPADPSVLAFVAVFLLAVAALASWLPARRAAGIEPSIALRQD
ncbi:MAG: ABC transporter permease [Acidobacteriota bacterium]|nr:ABC transporter permease [Acidobacteriota bacterium]